MIVDMVLSLVTVLVQGFDALFPTVAVPAWLTTDNFGSTVAGYVGALLAPISGWFPVDPFLNALYAVLVMLPLFGAYLVAEWVWRHVPTIAGFGTGNG